MKYAVVSNNLCTRIALLFSMANITTKEGQCTVSTCCLHASGAQSAKRINCLQFYASPPIHFVDDTRTVCKDMVNRRAGVQPRFYLSPILLHTLNYSPSLAFSHSYWSHLLLVLQVQHHTGTCWWKSSIANMHALKHRETDRWTSLVHLCFETDCSDIYKD